MKMNADENYECRWMQMSPEEWRCIPINEDGCSVIHMSADGYRLL